MALTTILELETHPDGTVGVSAIITGNWSRLEEIFDPTLASGDAAFGAFWRALTRNATDPTTPGAVIEWSPAQGKPIWRSGFQTVAYSAGSTSIDVDAGIEQEISLAGNLILGSLTNQNAGAHVDVIIRADGSSRNLSFPADWVFVGAAAPASIAANKTGLLHLKTTGATDADVIARYLVEP